VGRNTGEVDGEKMTASRSRDDQIVDSMILRRQKLECLSKADVWDRKSNWGISTKKKIDASLLQVMDQPSQEKLVDGVEYEERPAGKGPIAREKGPARAG